MYNTIKLLQFDVIHLQIDRTSDGCSTSNCHHVTMDTLETLLTPDGHHKDMVVCKFLLCTCRAGSGGTLEYWDVSDSTRWFRIWVAWSPTYRPSLRPRTWTWRGSVGSHSRGPCEASACSSGVHSAPTTTTTHLDIVIWWSNPHTEQLRIIIRPTSLRNYSKV